MIEKRWRALTAVLALAALPLIGTVTAAPPAAALGNGLALTPQMGFNDWNAYGCNVSESLIKSTADRIVSSGMAAAGYQYVNVDDCWLQNSRDSNGNLQPDFAKFPDGISGTAAYVHSKGLKFGIYEDAGSSTCAGYPGSLGHETQDANLFAAWGVDYLKYDNCFNDGSSAQSRYTTMRNALAATGRPILFSLCSWGSESEWTWGANVGNSWRTTGDITADYNSMLSIFHNNVGLASFAGPGHWNDPDMLEIGNGMSATEDRTEFSLWSEMAAPLISGTNLVNASATTLSIMTNKAVIAVDQDSLGKQGVQIASSGGLDVLARPLANGDVAVVLFNENSTTATVSTTAAAIGKTGAVSYSLTDLWSGAQTATSGAISASVPGHGTVMYRVAGGTTGGGGGGGGLNGTHSVTASGKNLDDPGSSTTAGTQLITWTPNGGTNQNWVFTQQSEGSYQIANALSNLCMDVSGGSSSAGAQVIQWTCNGQNNQRWTVTALSGGGYTVASKSSGLLLTTASTSDGAPVSQQTNTNSALQHWTIS